MEKNAEIAWWTHLDSDQRLGSDGNRRATAIALMRVVAKRGRRGKLSR